VSQAVLRRCTFVHVKRRQIYLDEGQDAELVRRALAEGSTKSALIRRAIDRYLEAFEDDDLRLVRFKTAVNAAAGIAPDLPRGSVYVERLRELDAHR
jgi:Ribbon-helix-helix protein, copG family